MIGVSVGKEHVDILPGDIERMQATRERLIAFRQVEPLIDDERALSFGYHV